VEKEVKKEEIKE